MCSCLVVLPLAWRFIQAGPKWKTVVDISLMGHCTYTSSISSVLLRAIIAWKWMVIATSACGSTETVIRFTNPRGECLATLDTKQVQSHDNFSCLVHVLSFPPHPDRGIPQGCGR